MKKIRKLFVLNNLRIFNVESGRVELPSKQAIKKTSTRLFLD